MRLLFPEFCKPSEEELRKIWAEAIFVFDTSILLGLYRLPRKLRIELISKVEKLADRAWIPHQVAMEYYRSRLEVIHEQERAYQNFLRVLRECEDSIVKQLEEYGRHPYIDNKKIISKIRESYKKIIKELDKKKQKQPDWHKDDEIEAALNNIFKKDKIGSEYEQRRLQEIYAEGKTRYEKDIPPGYKDKKKDNDDKTGIRKFGDLIIWFQIIDKATVSKKPIIFVTSEKKEDWWYSVGGKTVGARYELITEMKSKANVFFLMYQSDKFIENASKYLDIKFNKELIEEVKKLRSEGDRDRQDLVKPREDLSVLHEASITSDAMIVNEPNSPCQSSLQQDAVVNELPVTNKVNPKAENNICNKIE